MIQEITPYIIAGTIGALVGSNRELLKKAGKTDKKKIIFAGVRSYALLALFGALLADAQQTFGFQGLVLFGATFVASLILWSYIHTSLKNKQSGLTGELSAIMVYFLGVLVMSGGVQIAVILGITLATTIALKEKVHATFTKISKQEIETTLKFAAIAFVVLPLLPDEKYSLGQMLQIDLQNPIIQMEFFNPYSIWFFVVLMSGISYIGYILSKFVGAGKGIGISGAIGGLVSSTAVTSAMSELSKKHPNIIYPFVHGTLVANLIMFVRVILIVFIFHVALLEILLVPLGLMLLTLLALIYISIGKGRKDSITQKKTDQPKFRSPFQIGPALKFAGFIVAIKFLSGVALIYQDLWGEYALYAVSFFSGFADVDAISQDMSVKSLDGSIRNAVATTAIIIAVITNTFVKLSIAKIFGEKKFGNRIAFALGIVSLVGLASLFLLF